MSEDSLQGRRSMISLSSVSESEKIVSTSKLGSFGSDGITECMSYEDSISSQQQTVDESSSTMSLPSILSRGKTKEGEKIDSMLGRRLSSALALMGPLGRTLSGREKPPLTRLVEERGSNSPLTPVGGPHLSPSRYSSSKLVSLDLNGISSEGSKVLTPRRDTVDGISMKSPLPLTPRLSRSTV
jgi:hypothetical protein